MKKIRRYLLLFPIISMLAATPLKTESSSKKPKADKEKPVEHKMPSSIPKKLTVLSDLDEDTILQILKFIDNQTGLSCTFVSQNGTEESFDVFIGSFFKPKSEIVHPCTSDVWNQTNNGIVSWSRWKSCLVFNTVLLGDKTQGAGSNDTKLPVDLTGIISAIDPLKDKYTASALYTLYKKYGKTVLYRINGYIPLYMGTKTKLTAALGNGRYVGAYTIDGYAIPLLEAGYPIHINYTALDSDQFPVTTVVGTNIAFIATHAQNPRGAKYFIDFLASESFRQYVGKNFFFSPPYEKSQGSTQAKSDFLPLELEVNWVQTFAELWKDVAYPEGIDEKLLSELR